MFDFVGTPPIMKIALCVAMETSKNTISTWNFFEDFFSMKHDTFLILKLLIKFLKELVVGQGLFSAKSHCLFVEKEHCPPHTSEYVPKSSNFENYYALICFLIQH